MPESGSGPELSQEAKNTLKYVAIGGAVVVAGGLLYYMLADSSSGEPKAPKPTKYKAVSKNRFDNANWCPGSDGNDCFVTSDTKNREQKIKTGSQLIKLNDTRTMGWAFEKILKEMKTCEEPITATFLEHPQNEEVWQKAEASKKEANKFYKNNKNAEALEKYSEAIELHPTRKEYYGNRVLTHFKMKDYEKALEDCEQFEKLDPLTKWQRGVHLHGMTLQNLNRKPEALDKYRLAHQMDPTSKTAEKAQNRINEITKQMTRQQGAI